MRAAGVLFALLITMMMPAIAPAGSSDVVVEKPWSRASIGTARPGVAYMIVRNTGSDPVTLTGIETPAAAMPMIHKTTTDASGATGMAPAGDIVIPAGGSVALEPGGFHAMLMKLTGPLKEGTRYHLTLLFGDGGKVDVEVPVLGPAARGPEG